MTTFSDIFKKSFIEGFASGEIGIKAVIMALGTTFVISLYIFLIYRVITRKTFYSKNLNLSLVGVALITAAIIVTIQSNIVLSLGMVGALSIVRFRTAIKDPIDLMFLFWAISTGIICGAGLAEFAVVLSLALTVAIAILGRLPVVKAPMILAINSEKLDAEKEIMDVVNRYASHPQIKSRNINSTALDMIIELRTDNGGDLVNDLMEVEGICSASLMSHDGEVTY